jgi:nitrite reductase/ring-hydroxylating ferredoxin subunit
MENKTWSDYPAAPTPGTFVCPLSELSENHGKEVVFNGDGNSFRLILFLSQGKIVAYINGCKHFIGTPLNPNGIGNFLHPTNTNLIRCGVHGATYKKESGECLSEDCEGASLDSVPVMLQGENVVIAP